MLFVKLCVLAFLLVLVVHIDEQRCDYKGRSPRAAIVLIVLAAKQLLLHTVHSTLLSLEVRLRIIIPLYMHYAYCYLQLRSDRRSNSGRAHSVHFNNTKSHRTDHDGSQQHIFTK